MRSEVSLEENTSGSGSASEDAVDQQIAEAIRNLPEGLDEETKATIKDSLLETFKKAAPASSTATLTIRLVGVTVSDNDLTAMARSALQIIGSEAFSLDTIAVSHLDTGE